MVANMKVDKVANMKVDMVANMKVGLGSSGFRVHIMWNIHID